MRAETDRRGPIAPRPWKPGPADAAKGRVLEGSRTTLKRAPPPPPRRNRDHASMAQPSRSHMSRKTLHPARALPDYSATRPPCPESEKERISRSRPQPRSRCNSKENCRNGNVQLYVVHREQTREGCGPLGDRGLRVKNGRTGPHRAAFRSLKTGQSSRQDNASRMLGNA